MADTQTQHQARRETRPLSLLESALEEAVTAEGKRDVRNNKCLITKTEIAMDTYETCQCCVDLSRRKNGLSLVG